MPFPPPLLDAAAVRCSGRAQRLPAFRTPLLCYHFGSDTYHAYARALLLRITNLAEPPTPFELPPEQPAFPPEESALLQTLKPPDRPSCPAAPPTRAPCPAPCPPQEFEPDTNTILPHPLRPT
eukprot:6200962-Pleurochrysis_carterae.AAC.2